MFVSELHSITKSLSSLENGMNTTLTASGGLASVFNSSRGSKRRSGVSEPVLNPTNTVEKTQSRAYRHLFKVLLLKELENLEITSPWSGKFSVDADILLTQHEAQSGLSPQDRSLVQWSLYCDVISDYHISFTLYNNLLDDLAVPLQTGKLDAGDTKIFWDGAKKLLECCYDRITKLNNTNDKANITETLKILQHFARLDITSINLFPKKRYQWLQRDRNLTIEGVLYQAVKQRALHHFQYIAESIKSEENSEESRLQYLITLVTLARSDLDRAIEQYDEIFSKILKFRYVKILYEVYENKIASTVKPEVKEVCKFLNQVDKEDITVEYDMADGVPNVNENQLELGKMWLKLYLIVQKFSRLGQVLNETEWSSYAVANFHSWFFDGVSQWLEIAANKALFLVERAVNLDTLMPIDFHVKRSGSGPDIWDILSPLKISWQLLAWPDLEDRYTFVTKIVDDICICCQFYADKMINRVESVDTGNEKEVLVAQEWCVAINNIEYLRQNLEQFIQELGVDDIIKSLSEARTPKQVEQCEEAIKNVLANAYDAIGFKIISLLTIVVRKMMPSILRLLHEGTKLLHKDSSSMDPVMHYLEKNLDKTHQHMSSDNFSVILDLVWEQLGDVLFELVQDNLKKQRPPCFYSNLHECFKIMIQSFRKEGEVLSSSNRLKEIEHLLTIHGKDTTQLIHHHHLDRWREQKTIEDLKYTKNGILTVRAQFLDNNLKVQIINGRNYVPISSYESCNSCVEVKLLPNKTFSNVKTMVTKSHERNVVALYGETFLFSLAENQCKMTDGLIHFKVKDLFGLKSLRSTFMAEAYLHFSEVTRTSDDIHSLRQLMLPLTRIESLDKEVIKALEYRNDKEARKFIKEQKRIAPFATAQFYVKLC